MNMSRPPTLMQPGGMPAPAGTTMSADGMSLKRPEPPTLRVLEPLMPPPGSDGKRVSLEIVEEDDTAAAVDEDDWGQKKGKKKGGARKEKVTAEMKRAARKAREAQREEKAMANRKEREEIFEVGDEGMSLEQLGEIIQVDASDIVRSLFMKGIMLSMNQVLDKNTCKVVAAEYGLLVVDKEEEVPTDKAKNRKEYVTEEDIDDLESRPPVVTVMGHVDHGKTSLLDYMRKARVAAGEAGGITQSIGAYNTTVEIDGEKKVICFLDTPGHEAFSAMRARGAQVTDIAIIIVAADDGVRPQTREAVMHAQAAEVPIIVAINKIDKPGADVDRVKQELLELNLVAEEWGGNTPMVPVSAKKGTGMDDLLQMISWVAEEKKLVANGKRAAAGTIIEAHLDRKVGPVATLLVQAGTLRVGDLVSAGASYGKVRSLRDDLGRPMDLAGPSIAVQLVGLNSVPNAGEEWAVVPSEAAARDAADKSVEMFRAARFQEMTGNSMVTLSSLATIDEDTEALQRLNVIIKGDTMGVVEAIKAALSSLPQQSISLRTLLSGAGDISVSDVDLAAASGALVLGFNLNPDNVVEEHAKRLNVKLMTYKVIYDLLDDVKAAMEGKLRSVEERIVLGKAEVKAQFGTGKKKVAGCVVTSGKLLKGAMVSVKRGKVVVFEGKLSSLRRIKDNVEEVTEGLECGAGCEDFLEWQPGDLMECYQMVTKTRRLEDARASTAVDMSTLSM